jgi:hypothetical protein
MYTEKFASLQSQYGLGNGSGEYLLSPIAGYAQGVELEAYVDFVVLA